MEGDEWETGDTITFLGLKLPVVHFGRSSADVCAGNEGCQLLRSRFDFLNF